LAWYGNRVLALVGALTCALTGLAADVWSADAEPIYNVANFAARLALFTIVALAFSRLRTALAEERELAHRQLLLAEKERDLRQLQDALMSSVVEGSREPLGDIYARVVDLSFDGEEMTQEDARKLLRELAEASVKVSRLIGSLQV
jgi:K+-sensing histidine kinase KdpD